MSKNGNFVGYMDGYTPTREDEEKNLLSNLTDRRFHGSKNDWIKKHISELYDVFEAIVTKGNNEKADTMLKNLYSEAGFDYVDEDNFFCYTLADKLCENKGIENKKYYEQ